MVMEQDMLEEVWNFGLIKNKSMINYFIKNTCDNYRMCLLFLLLMLSTVLYSQVHVGIGLVQDNHNLTPEFVKLPDNILLTTTDGDPGLFLLISKPLKGKGIWIYSLDILYYKKYQSMFVIKTDPTFIDIAKRSFIASGNIQFLVNAGINPTIRPLRKIKFLAGIGPSIYFNSKPMREDFIDAPELEESFYQSQRIHRNFSLIYSLRALYQISNRFELSLISQGNITTINHPIMLNGNALNTRTRWKNLGMLLTYSFNP